MDATEAYVRERVDFSSWGGSGTPDANKDILIKAERVITEDNGDTTDFWLCSLCEDAGLYPSPYPSLHTDEEDPLNWVRP